MADEGTRSVAEKLAAAKKKHKAYLKEKILKNKENNSQDLDLRNTSNQPIKVQSNTNLITEDQLHDNVNDTKYSNIKPDSMFTDAVEPDFPLPQYSMDYNNQAQTILPDPLSFFDNFSSVGATFQNFTQPLASFFNNSSNLPDHNLLEQPNQILVEETNAHSNCKTLNANSALEKTAQEIFSYENFKSNAISNIPKETINIENLQSSYENENLVYESFVNSSNVTESKPFISDQEYPNNSHKNKVETDASIDGFVNISNDSQNYEINIPAVFHVKSEPEMMMACKNDNEKNRNRETNQIIEKNKLLPISNSEIEINKSFNFQNLLNNSVESQQLIEREQISLDADNSDERNRELQGLLDSQREHYASLRSQLQESEMKYSKLLTDFKALKIERDHNEEIFKSGSEIQNDLSKLKEDLQCHLQTIGLLVAEKTELSALLSDTQLSLKNEVSQRLELIEKMEGLKEFCSNLEKDLELIKFKKNSLCISQKEQMSMFNTMQEDYNKLTHKYDEAVQDLLESKEQLKLFTAKNCNLEKDIQDLRGQLSLANIKIQQLTLEEGATQQSQLDELMQEKVELLKQISFLNDTLKTMSKESEESGMHYQQYAEQLNLQIRNLAGKLEHYQRENEQLKNQEDIRIKHIGDLEKQLQNIQNDNTSHSQRNSNMLKKEVEAAMETVEQLRTEKEDLNASLTKALIEKELLQKDLDSCKFSISQFESTVEQLRGSQPDNAVLLATMESDKVAASRAIAQNNELKRQMEGLQEVLLKVNNDNVQLTENVSLERKTNKDIFEKLQRTEISLQTLAEAIEIKDKELVNLREKLEITYRQVAHHEQLSDRLRHYEAQDYSSPSLQKELEEAKHMIANLTNELNTLKQHQLIQTHQMNQTIDVCQTDQDTQTGQNLKMDDSVSETAYTVAELKSQLNSLQMRNSELELLLQNLRMNDTKRTDANGNVSLDKETAMRHLEKKFLRTMEEISRLTEEKQRLEHLVLQLQGETETIGEYVSLYQQQRSILKQRALEKDQQLQQLTNDRESIKANLDRLNSLVNRLIVEKGGITKELMEQHEYFTREHDDLCDEHQKMHQEINKITGDGFKNSGVSDNANTEIAAEIMSLLTEIKSCNLVQPAEGIHHCPWCSGKLITV